MGWHLRPYNGSCSILLVSKGPIDQANVLVNALRAERLMVRLNSLLNINKGI
jgi:hypothetical protein